MTKKKFLIIVESPSKCAKIEKYLTQSFPNTTFKVIASVGHIKNLPYKKLSIDIAGGYKPDFQLIDDENNLKTVNSIKSLARKFGKKNVILATDQDREGERIAYDLSTLLNLDVKSKNRMVFNEITKPAIKKAFNNLQTINQKYVNSQTARRVLDRLIGYKVSPLTMKYIQKKASAGRVLSVTTKLIYDRKQEIDQHGGGYQFSVKGDFKTKSKKDLIDCDLNTKFEDQKKVMAFLKKTQKKDYYIGSITSKEKKSNPPAPFITSSINGASPYSVSKTTAILQKLYQGGFITYIRTDSTAISEDFQKTILDFVKNKYGAKYPKSRQYSKKVKGSQDAHECIRPTDISRNFTEIKNPEQKKLYDLIWKRTVACQMSEWVYNSKTIKINIKTIKKQYYSKICNETIFDGWKKLYQITDDKEQIAICKSIKEKELVKMINVNAKQCYNKPLGRYTEGSLIKKLEELGIGRPSTYSGAVSNIINKNYVNKGDVKGKEMDCTTIVMTPKSIKQSSVKEFVGSENKRLILTPLGNEITIYMNKNFPKIMDYNYTSNIETDLDLIADGKKTWNTDVVDKYYNVFNKTVDTLMKQYYENRKKCKSDPNCIDPNLIGEHQGQKLYRFSSNWGPRVRVGEFGAKDTLYLTVPNGTLLSDLTLDDAIQLYPKDLGKYLNRPIVLWHGSGRSKYFIKHGKENFPLHFDYKNKEKKDITKQDCVKSIKSFKEYQEKKNGGKPSETKQTIKKTTKKTTKKRTYKKRKSQNKN